MAEHVDVLVVGAGISGIGQGYHLQTRCPDRSYLILEAREALGGTWDLFRYPGIRSDSDMHTLGFSFHPWTDDRSIAAGATIRAYVEEAARTYGIDRRIRFRHRVTAAAWSTADARWTVEVSGPDGELLVFTCHFLCLCSGYYTYAHAHTPHFPDAQRFAGCIIHPQFWPNDLDYAGKRVIVIGSGATAVTLVPALATTAAHVAMLQRSPTYVVSRPAEDRLANWLRAGLPGKGAYRITRWKNVLTSIVYYRLAKARPGEVRGRLLGMVRKHLGPDYDIDTHFTPRYAPWDQRICLVPDADLFASITRGDASVVTGTIDRFTETGIRLTSGEVLAADVIVTATGLQLQWLSDIRFTRDGAPIAFDKTIQYKGMMFSDVPNLAYTFGYTNASWTLKAELVATYVCRLLNTMRRRGLRQATPRLRDAAMETEPFVDLTSGYIQRAAHLLPRQGARKPWRLNQNYLLDVMALRFGSVDDEMVFDNPEPVRRDAA